MWGLWVPLAWFLGLKLGLGLIGIWISMICDEWTRAACWMYQTLAETQMAAGLRSAGCLTRLGSGGDAIGLRSTKRRAAGRGEAIRSWSAYKRCTSIKSFPASDTVGPGELRRTVLTADQRDRTGKSANP